jgi:hypothetical protein
METSRLTPPHSPLPLGRAASARSIQQRAALDRLTKAQAEALEKLRDALRVHLEPISFAERSKGLRRGIPGSAEFDKLGKVPFKPCRRDDLEDSCRLLAGVPERMPLVTRLEN